MCNSKLVSFHCSSETVCLSQTLRAQHLIHLTLWEQNRLLVHTRHLPSFIFDNVWLPTKIRTMDNSQKQLLGGVLVKLQTQVVAFEIL